jgi:adenylate cyclase
MGVASDDDGLLLQGNMDVGWTYFFLGEFEQARQHLERVLALYDDERHSSHTFVFGDNPATSARSVLASVMWLLGYPDQSLRVSEQNLSILRSSVQHVPSLVFSLDVAAFLRQYLGDAPAIHALADEALALSEQHSLAFFGAMAAMLRGWALTREGDLGEGLAQMRRGLAAQLATGAVLARPYWLCLIAEAIDRTDGAGAGLELLAEAERAVEQTQERYWEAEIHRVRADLLRAAAESDAPSAVPSADESYQHALDVARRQGARSLELRAAVSLAQAWHAAGRRHEARKVLTPIYDWFSEGHETTDVQAAAALLTELSAESAMSTT